MTGFETSLANGIKYLDIDIDKEKQHKLISYLYHIEKWNKVYNLTAILDFEEMLVRHLLDCIAVYPYINDDNILDIGSGAGLPSVVLAIIKPSLKVYALDSVGKKCNFMNYVKSEFNLNNLKVINDRVELYKTNDKFNQIITRAFADIDKTIELSNHLLANKGRYLFMKSDSFYKESLSQYNNVIIHKLKIPRILNNRYLVEILI